MSDLSNLVMPMSYSVKNAIDNVGDNNINSDASGWKSTLDNSENTIVVQINLDSAHSFNRLSFELLDVPQKFSVFYRDQNRNKFVKIKTYKGFVNGIVNGSRAGLDSQDLWQSFSFSFPFVNTDLIEIRINRINNALSSFNLPKTTRYSVGIKNAQIRFHRVGSAISSINEDDEYTVNYFSPNSVLNENDTFWKSPPLGPNSLYPFFVDLRTESGKAQVVEFMKLIPLYTDSHVNVYYSNDDSFGPFGLSNNQKTFNLMGNANNLNSYWTEDKGIELQSTSLAEPKYWQLNNKDIKLDLRSSFTLGFTYECTNFINTDVDHKFWSLSSTTDDILSFYFDPETTGTDLTNTDYVEGSLIVQYEKLVDVEEGWQTNEMIRVENVRFNSNVSYGITVTYDPKNFEWIVTTCPMETEDLNVSTNINIFNGFYPEIINLNLNPNTIIETLGYLRNLWMRQDTFQFNYVISFLRNTDTFIRGLGALGQRNNGYYNAVLVAPLTDDLNAKVGPNSAYYNNKVWTPANRSFVLNSSIYNLGRLKTKYLKLEFAKPTVQYYNPATSEDVVLPVLDFPDWVKEWFTIHQFDSSVDRTLGNNVLFEGSRVLNNVSSAYGLNSFKSAIESSDNNLIFNHDQIGYDFFLSSSTDDESLRNQIIRNAITLQFPTTSRHVYKIYDYVMATKRAFFYGIVELNFFQQDQTLEKDNRIYYGDFIEDDLTSINWIDNVNGFFGDKETAKAENAGDQITSKTLQSFSNFSSVQIAYLESPFKDLKFDTENEAVTTSQQINFVDTSHLSTIGNADISVVDNLRGTTDGKTILLKRSSSGIYGFETSQSDVTHSAPTKFIAGCRIRSGTKNPHSNYELRLMSLIDEGSGETWKTVAKKQLKLLPNYEWTEIDLIYNSKEVDSKLKLAIVHLDSFSNETLYVDMLGIWMERNHWELSNDNGSTWVSVINNANNVLGMVSFENPGNQLKLRITSKEPSSWVSQWLIIPIYNSVPVGMSTPRLFEVSNVDDSEYQDLMNQKLFLPYSTQIPRNYSIMTDVINSKNRI